MFFDEFYEETFNRCDTIRTFLKDTDAVLVIGTALQTGFANEIVTTAFEEEKQIVELNTAC
jgi:NAD-dependent SIR2 family protein deacetylase